MAQDPPIPVHVHGLRNRTAEFKGCAARMLIGSMTAGPDYKGNTGSVLMTVEGVDEATGKTVDIEIAVSVDDADRLVGLLQDRTAGLRQS